MIHPSALKKALKERKKRILFLFPFPFLIGVLIFRPKDSLPNEPLSPPPAIIPVLPQKKEKAGLVPPRRDPFEGLFHSHSPVPRPFPTAKDDFPFPFGKREKTESPMLRLSGILTVDGCRKALFIGPEKTYLLETMDKIPQRGQVRAIHSDSIIWNNMVIPVGEVIP